MDPYRGRIREQLRILGASCDWSRFVFTMDPGPSRAVRKAFKRLYDQGLIYRGERIINWCPRCRTALSDLEVDHQEEQSARSGTSRYPRGRIDPPARRSPSPRPGRRRCSATPASPSTRTTSATGTWSASRVRLPILDRLIPIVADEAVDPAFGTGAVKVTPAHDPNDFEIGQRHSLPFVTVMNLDGTMNENAGPFAGQLDRPRPDATW